MTYQPATIGDALLRYYPRTDINDNRWLVIDGDLVQWDAALGPQPTEQQISAWLAEIDGERAAAAALWQSRLAMADAWAGLPADMRADHAHDYACIEAALIRGDVEAARLRIERAVLLPEREQYRAQFLSLFPQQAE